MVPSILSNAIFAQFLASTPTAVNAIAYSPTGIPFNPSKKILDAVCSGWVTGIKSLPLTGTYIGVAGPGGVVPPMKISFPAASGALGAFMGSSGWVGRKGLTVAQLYTTKIATQTTAMGFLQVPPIPGAGLGTFTVAPVFNAGITSAGPVFTAKIQQSLLSTGMFGAILSPQLTSLTFKIGTALATILASATGSSPVAGAPSPTAITIPMAGTFL